MILLLAIGFISCKSKTSYQCICTSVNGNPYGDSSYNLGEVSNTQARNECIIHNSSTDSCTLIGIK